MAVLNVIISVWGFFGTVIAFILSRTYLAKLKAQSQAGGAAGQEDVLAAVEELRREVAELAERVDFTERLLRSEEHTSELQSRQYLVCRLLLEKKKYSNM